MIPEMPLPASKVGLAEITKISALISKIELYLIVSIMKFYGRYVCLHNLLWECTILIGKLITILTNDSAKMQEEQIINKVQ